MYTESHLPSASPSLRLLRAVPGPDPLPEVAPWKVGLWKCIGKDLGQQLLFTSGALITEGHYLVSDSVELSAPPPPHHHLMKGLHGMEKSWLPGSRPPHKGEMQAESPISDHISRASGFTWLAWDLQKMTDS